MKSTLRMCVTTAIISAVVLFFCLQRAAASMVGYLHQNDPVILWDDYVRLSLSENRAAAFSLPFPDAAIYAAALIVLFFIIREILSGRQAKPAFVGSVLMMAGIASNIYERVSRGSVADYFMFQIGQVRGVWNLADFFILIGLVLLFFWHAKKGDLPYAD